MSLINYPEEFKNFVLFSFPKIKTYLNEKNEEKKRVFLGEWKNIVKTKININHESLAIKTGKISDITVFDFDNIDEYNRIINDMPELKNVFRVKTNKGYHLYFRYNKDVKTGQNSLKSYKNVDIRNDDAILFCPCTKYTLLNGDEIEYKFIKGDLIEIPKNLFLDLKEIKSKTKKIIEIENEENTDTEEIENIFTYKKIKELINLLDIERCNNYQSWINVGFIIFNELQENGFQLFDEWSQKSKKYNYKDVKDKYHSFKLDKKGLKLETLQMYVKEDKFLKENKNDYENDKKFFVLNDFSTGNIAIDFKERYKNKFIYTDGILYYYEMVLWSIDDKNNSFLNNFIDEVYFLDLLKLYQEYELIIMSKAKNNDKDAFKKIRTIRTNLEKLRIIKSREGYIKDIINKITNNKIKWNNQPDIFAFDNKLFDLKKNQFIEPKAEYYLSLSCGYDFNDNYDEKNIFELEEFLKTIHSNDEIRNCYLECLSTGLSGQTLEKFIIANGRGGNGKGVYNELALKTFGNYGYILPSNVLLNPLKTGSNPEIANCDKKRLIFVREPDESKNLNCSTIKEITGGGEINARLNHSNNTKTVLNCTMIMECNEKPKLSEVNEAMERRILDIPFNSLFVDKMKFEKFSDQERKENEIFLGNTFFKTYDFKEKYKQALFMILIKHYKSYIDNNNNLTIPKIIVDRTNSYMENSDDIFNIINEFYEKTPEKKDIIKLKDVYEMFKSSDMYFNSSKDDKKKLIYKSFCSKLQSNLFFRTLIKTNKDKVLILTNHKLKTDLI